MSDPWVGPGDGEHSVTTLVEEVLADVAARDATLVAFLAVDRPGARRAAAAADARRAVGESGLLLGMPVAVKDAYTTVVPPTTYGSRCDPGLPAADAVVVRRLRAAGAVIVGKTNMSELCIGEYVLRGPPRPPLTPDLSPGASSGGCAVAVSAGLVTGSVGTDTGGSVRGPAAYCGVVGFKPTRGLIPLDGAVALAPSLDHGGVLARTVDDAVAVAEVLAGRGLRGARPVRVLVVSPESVANAAVAAALARVAASNPPAGTALAPAPAGIFEGWRDAFSILMPADAARANGAAIADPRLGDAARAVYAAGAAIPRATIGRACREAEAFRRRVAVALGRGTVLVSPAVDGVARSDLPARGSDAFWTEMDWHAPANITGGPALCVPVPRTLPPVGLQVVGSPGCDAVVISTAGWVEHVLA